MDNKDGLTAEQSQILDFEERWTDQFSTKAEGIRATFDISPSIYHIRLNALLDNPAALYARPMTVSRLRRLRDARQVERGSLHDESPNEG